MGLKQWVLARFPLLYKWRVVQLQWKRKLLNLSPKLRFSKVLQSETLPHLCKKHKSLLRRKLGQTDPQLQENKIVNLQLSVPLIDGIVIQPGETFSYWKLIGKTSAERGYLEGLMLSRGEVVTGVGGGLCQLANLLFWLALHSPLQIAERHHHSFDMFPDERRVVPFGSGTSVFYNYVDLRFYNPTNHPFQIKVWLTDQFLEGAIYSDTKLPYEIEIQERNHHFYTKNDKIFRENELWRILTDPITGQEIQEERILRNHAEVKYSMPVSV